MNVSIYRLQDNVLVWDWRSGTDRTLWHGRLRQEGGGQPRSRAACQRDGGHSDWQTVLDRREAPVYRLGDAGWRKHEGNVKCFKRASTISASLWFLYNFLFFSCYSCRRCLVFSLWLCLTTWSTGLTLKEDPFKLPINWLARTAKFFSRDPGSRLTSKWEYMLYTLLNVIPVNVSCITECFPFLFWSRLSTLFCSPMCLVRVRSSDALTCVCWRRGLTRSVAAQRSFS